MPVFTSPRTVITPHTLATVILSWQLFFFFFYHLLLLFRSSLFIWVIGV